MRPFAAAPGDPVFTPKNLLVPRGGVFKNNVQSYGAFSAHWIHGTFLDFSPSICLNIFISVNEMQLRRCVLII